LEIMERLHDVCWKHLNIWVLYHDNAPAHDVLVAPEILAKTSVKILNHPPYLPDLDQYIFWLFQKLTTTLKGQWLSDVASIQRHANTILKSIPVRGVSAVL